MPLVLAFHPVGGDGENMEQITGFNQLADKEGFIAVYPDAVNRHWDARRADKPDTTNDIGFISALIDELSQRYTIDRNRIYATGFSNGATFSHRLGCELSDKISAIASVAAAMPAYLASTCQPTKPISVLLMNGTKDEAFPYASAGKGMLSLPDTIKFWKTHNRCSAQAVKSFLPQSPHVRLDTYGKCADQTNVALYTIEGGEHSWGDDSISGSNNLVKPGQEINESKIIWSFFSQQSGKPSKS